MPSLCKLATCVLMMTSQKNNATCKRIKMCKG
nr:MAG TPA: hypothetical protein [Caudoviricetes sp.]